MPNEPPTISNVAGPVSVRGLTLGEAEQFLGVFSEAFHLDAVAARPLFYRDPFFNLDLKRVCVVDGRVVSCLTIVPVQLRIGAAVVPMAGIAGVATLAKHRRLGYAGTLLADTVQAAADLGYPLSGLFPVEPPYYARFGWAFATRLCRWTHPREHLPGSAESGRVRAVRAQRDHVDLAAIAAVQATVNSNRTGACVRGDERWTVINHMLTGRQTLVCEEGAITGYIHLEQIPSIGKLFVHEMHASTDIAAQALLGYLASQEAYNDVEWIAPSADLARFGFSDVFNERGHAQVMVEPDAMLRINDLIQALTLVHAGNYASILAEERETLTILASDSVNPANDRPVVLTPTAVVPADTLSESTRTSDGRIVRDRNVHSITADIAALIQIYVGYLTPSEAVDLGVLTASSPHALALADRLFPSRDPHIPALDRF